MVVTPSVSGLKNLPNKYMQDHNLLSSKVYNATKSYFMVSRGKVKRPAYSDNVIWNGMPFNRNTQFKYLGHMATEDLKDLTERKLTVYC